MSKAGWIEEDVWKRIDFLAEEYPTLTARGIRQRVSAEFPGWNIPKEGTIQKRIGPIRRFKEAGVDVPWGSIGGSLNTVSDDALPDVLAVWRHCLVCGHDLTQRQVQWIARLREVVTNRVEAMRRKCYDDFVEKWRNDNPSIPAVPLPEELWLRGPVAEGERVRELYEWSTLYANRERASLALKRPLRTDDLDARLVFIGESYRAMVNSGRVSEFRYFDDRIETLWKLDWADKAEFQEAVEEEYRRQLLDLCRQPESAANVVEDAGRQTALQEKRRSIFAQLSLSDVTAATEVSIIWGLEFVRKGTKWHQLDRQRCDEVSVTLDEQIAEHFESMPDTLRYGHGLASMGFWPSEELLEEVGYRTQAAAREPAPLTRV